MAVRASGSKQCGWTDESLFSTTHVSVNAMRSHFKRFPATRVPGGTDPLVVGAYMQRCEGLAGEPRVVVASALRRLRERPVASALSSSRSVASAFDRVRRLLVASASPNSPRVVLGPVLQSARRAVLANKCLRIARRLALRAAGRPKQPLH